MATKKSQFKTGLSWAKSLGKDIEDADEPLEIVLTKSDITKGVPLDHTKCAFAQSVCRQERAVAAWIGISTAYVEWDDVVWRYKVPDSVARELVSFDRSKISDVGEFHLVPFAKSMWLGAPPKKPPRKVLNRKKEGSGRHYTGMIRHTGK